MFIQRESSQLNLNPLNYLLWFILALQAGMINVGGFMTCRRFVTHVTGFATHFGEEVAEGAFFKATSTLMVPLFFLLGCMTSAFLIDQRKHLDRRPLYPETFLGSGIAFSMLSFMGVFGLLGAFGDLTQGPKIFMILSTLSFLSGLQNSMISLASGLLVRTTHLTGITTDLGVGIMRMLYPRRSLPQRNHELKLNLLRLGTISAFILGSIIGGLVFAHWKFLGFLIPSLTCFLLARASWKQQISQPQSPHSVTPHSVTPHPARPQGEGQ